NRSRTAPVRLRRTPGTARRRTRARDPSASRPRRTTSRRRNRRRRAYNRVPLRSSYPRPLSHGDGGAVGDKGGSRFRAQTFDEPMAVCPLYVAFESGLARSPDAPTRMLDPIFDAPAATLRGVTPVMFSDELLFRTFDERLRDARGLRADVMPRSAVAPRIFDRSIRRDRSVVQIDS